MYIARCNASAILLILTLWTSSPTYDACSSFWSGVETGPPDAIFGLVEAHKKDPRPNKVSLAIGAYRDDQGKPWVLPTVRKAEQRIVDKNLDKEYAGIMGYESFCKEAYKLAFGEDDNFKNNSVSSVLFDRRFTCMIRYNDMPNMYGGHI